MGPRSARVHADRAAGRHRDHCRADRPAAPRGPGGARGGPAVAVRQQPEADRAGAAQLPRRQRSLSAGCPVALPAPGDTSRDGGEQLGLQPAGAAARLHGAAGAVQRREFQLRRLQRRRLGTPKNSTVTITPINTFLCPSGPTPGWNFTGRRRRWASSGLPATATSPRWGSSLEFAANQTGGPPNGPFPYLGPNGHAVGLRDITDGTSNTIGFGEWKIGSGILTRISIQDIVFIGTYPSGTTRNNGTLNFPNPTLVTAFPAWLNTCGQMYASGKRPLRQDGHPRRDLGLRPARLFPGRSCLAPNPKYPNCSVERGRHDRERRHAEHEQLPPRRLRTS